MTPADKLKARLDARGVANLPVTCSKCGGSVYAGLTRAENLAKLLAGEKVYVTCSCGARLDASKYPEVRLAVKESQE